jgi:zinc transport system substrate-binding protein
MIWARRLRHARLHWLAFVFAVGLFVVGVATWALTSYLVDGRPTSPPTLRVAVTVPPQAWLVRQIGGERVDVEVLLPPGASEHTYEATPQQVARVADARLVVRVGHPGLLFERRLLDGIDATPRARPLEVVDMSRGVAVLPEPGSGPGAWVSDPHLWLSPAAMRRAAEDTAAALTRLDPSSAALYERQLRGVLDEIDGAAATLRADLGGLAHRRLYMDHPTWTYLLHDFGIEQVAIERDGKEPSARQLVDLVETARRDGVRTVFVQQGHSDHSVRALAQEIGARVVTVDPLAEDWPVNVRKTAHLFREALGG